MNLECLVCKSNLINVRHLNIFNFQIIKNKKNINICLCNKHKYIAEQSLKNNNFYENFLQILNNYYNNKKYNYIYDSRFIWF